MRVNGCHSLALKNRNNCRHPKLYPQQEERLLWQACTGPACPRRLAIVGTHVSAQVDLVAKAAVAGFSSRRNERALIRFFPGVSAHVAQQG